jgi:type IV secretory pathway VirJ component
MRRVARILAGAAGLLTVAAGALFYAIGWFGGPIMTDVPSQAAAPVAERDVVAVLLSGDLGFHIRMAGATAGHLADAGIPTVGINSLTYFARPRTPAEATRVIEAAMLRAMRTTGRHRIVLIGQSFGADMLHVGLAALPRRLRGHVALVALVVPSSDVVMQASPGEIMPTSAPTADALLTASRLGWTRTLCIYGVEETDSLCPRLRVPNLTRVGLPGGHGLHRNTDALARIILTAIARAVTAFPSHALSGT